MYRLPFELTDSAKLLHFTILGGAQLNDATAYCFVLIISRSGSQGRRLELGLECTSRVSPVP